MQPENHAPSADVQNLISTAAKISAAPPRAARVTRYGPDGNGVAGTGSATYGIDETGAAATIHYESALPGGQVCARTAVSLDAQGRVTTAQSDRLDAAGQVVGCVTGDYSRLATNAAGQPISGTAVIKTTDPDGKPLHHTEMTYARETLASLSQSSYDPASGRRSAGLAVDYAEAESLGTRLIGGSLSLSRTRADGSLASRTTSHLIRFGVPDLVETQTYGADGKTSAEKLTSNYAGVTFDPRRKVNGGRLMVVAADAAGAVMGRTLFEYADGKVRRVAPVPEGELLDVAAGAPYPAAAVTGPNRPYRSPDKTVETKRPDGSLLERADYWVMADGAGGTVPRRTILTLFAPDGRTVVRETDVDFSGVSFAAGGVPKGGAVVATKFEDGIRNSITHVTY